MRPFKLKETPKLTEKQLVQGLEFAREPLRWSEEEWRKMVLADELAYSPSRHNDSVGDQHSDVPTVPGVNHSARIHIWSMFRCPVLF